MSPLQLALIELSRDILVNDLDTEQIASRLLQIAIGINEDNFLGLSKVKAIKYLKENIPFDVYKNSFKLLDANKDSFKLQKAEEPISVIRWGLKEQKEIVETIANFIEQETGKEVWG